MSTEPTESVRVAPRYTIATLDQVISAHLQHALELHAWDMARAAHALNVDRKTLSRLVKRHEVKKLEPVPEPEQLEEAITLDELLDQSSALSDDAESPA